MDPEDTMYGAAWLNAQPDEKKLIWPWPIWICIRFYVYVPCPTAGLWIWVQAPGWAWVYANGQYVPGSSGYAWGGRWVYVSPNYLKCGRRN